EPGSLGTEISRRRTLEQYPVKALSAIPGQALLTVTGSGMLGVPGIAARTFAAVHQEGISVSLITQASSEHSICFSVPEESAQRARRSLEETFQREIARQEIDGVEARTGLATLAAAKAKGTPLTKAAGTQSEARRAGATEAVKFVAGHALANPVLVDVTADDTTEAVTAALSAGMHVVLANKRPVTTDKR